MTTNVTAISTAWTQVSASGAFSIHHTTIGGDVKYSRQIHDPVYLQSSLLQPESTDPGPGNFYCGPLEDWTQQDHDAGPWWIRLDAGLISDRWVDIAVEANV